MTKDGENVGPKGREATEDCVLPMPVESTFEFELFSLI